MPPPFSEDPTRQVDEHLLSALRAMPAADAAPPQQAPLHLPSEPSQPYFEDGPTRMSPFDPRELDDLAIEGGLEPDPAHEPAFDRFLAQAPATDPQGPFDYHDDATRLSNLDGIAAMERARHNPVGHDERTRAVNIRNDKSISDIDWDLD